MSSAREERSAPIPGTVQLADDARPAWQRAALVTALIVAISLAHASTSTHHSGLHALYEYLYYVPILMAAYWYAPYGGLAAGFFAAVMYIPHIQTSWTDNPPYAASQYGQVIAFHLVGGIVGVLVARLKRSTRDARQTADALAVKNRELMESHEQLTRAERLSSLGTLAAGLVHEVRTPIAAMKGALDILASRARPGTPEAEFTHLATSELTRLGNLLEEFLAYARPRPPARGPVRLRELIGQVESLLSAEAHARRVTLLIHADTHGDVTADPGQITQVLLNLVLNAIQASPPESVVDLDLEDRGDHVAIRILDRGAGLSPEVRAHLFEPFFTTKTKGSGLGLPIAQRIITAHGGTIELVAASPTGTVATVTLPRGPRRQENPA